MVFQEQHLFLNRMLFGFSKDIHFVCIKDYMLQIFQQIKILYIKVYYIEFVLEQIFMRRYDTSSITSQCSISKDIQEKFIIGISFHSNVIEIDHVYYFINVYFHLFTFWFYIIWLYYFLIYNVQIDCVDVYKGFNNPLLVVFHFSGKLTL